MNCSELHRFAEAYVDGEFDAMDKAEIDAHLAECDRCRSGITAVEGFRLFLKDQTRSPSSPPHLTTTITAMVSSHSAQGHIRPIWWASGLAAAVVLALAGATVWRSSHQPNGLEGDLVNVPVIDASVNWHRRNLPVEVTGPDLSVLGEWFSSQVDFPVRLPTFQNRTIRANLLGGRLSHLEDQDAAHLLYEVDGAKLSIMMFPTSERRQNIPVLRNRDRQFLMFNRNGYNVALFNNDGVTYSITSALPQSRLRELVQSAAFRNY